MIISDVKNIKIAKKYANALLESAIESGCSDKVYNDLIFVVETVISNGQLADILKNPIVKDSDKKDIINKLFSIHIDKITLELLFVLADNRRLDILSEILNQFSNLYNKINNIVKPYIISAVELNEEQRNKIIKKLENKLSKKVIPQYCINEEIIGGLIIEIDDKTIDCSLKTKFDNMRKQLTKGNKYGSY